MPLQVGPDAEGICLCVWAQLYSNTVVIIQVIVYSLSARRSSVQVKDDLKKESANLEKRIMNKSLDEDVSHDVWLCMCYY